MTRSDYSVFIFHEMYRKFNEITHFQSKFTVAKNFQPVKHFQNDASSPSHPSFSSQSPANQLSKKGEKKKQTNKKEKKRKLLHGYFANRFTGRKNNSRSRDSPPSFTRRTRCTVSYINVPQEGGRTSRQRADAPRN